MPCVFQVVSNLEEVSMAKRNIELKREQILKMDQVYLLGYHGNVDIDKD